MAAWSADWSDSLSLSLLLLEQFLELINALLGGVAGLGQLAPLLVVGGVGVGVALHPLDLVLVEAAGGLDVDRRAPCRSPGRGP